jgi:hypothetical protein
MTSEILSYLKAKYEKLGESVTIEQMQSKFKDKDVPTFIQQLLQDGIIFEPRPGLFRWLG